MSLKCGSGKRNVEEIAPGFEANFNSAHDQLECDISGMITPYNAVYKPDIPIIDLPGCSKRPVAYYPDI